MEVTDMLSDNVKEGVQQAPHRSLFNALGFTKEEMKKPMIGIVCSYNEIIPGHMNLDKIAQAVKLGVAEAGGMPVMFPAIAVCDGIAMGHVGMKYSLVTRELIADSTECMARAHQFDGLVMIPNCDKNVPGLLMSLFPAALCLRDMSAEERDRCPRCSKRSALTTPVRSRERSLRILRRMSARPAVPVPACTRQIR